MMGLAAAGAQARSLYVPSYENNTVSVVNTSTNTVTSTIDVPASLGCCDHTGRGKTVWVEEYSNQRTGADLGEHRSAGHPCPDHGSRRSGGPGDHA